MELSQFLSDLRVEYVGSQCIELSDVTSKSEGHELGLINRPHPPKLKPVKESSSRL